jgi:hypothetical protein
MDRICPFYGDVRSVGREAATRCNSASVRVRRMSGGSVEVRGVWFEAVIRRAEASRITCAFSNPTWRADSGDPAR